MPSFIALSTLCELPPGSIFAESDQHGNAKGLYRKGKTIPNRPKHSGGAYADFYFHNLLVTMDFVADSSGNGFVDIEDGARWGLYDPAQAFVLYDADDVRKLVGLLTGTTKVGDET